MPDLQVANDPDPEQIDGIFPACAVTRAASRRATTDDKDN